VADSARPLLLPGIAHGHTGRVRNHWCVREESPAVARRSPGGCINPHLAGCSQRPIHLAAKAGHVAIMRLLHAAGASVEAEDVEGGRAMHFCSSTGQVEAIRTLHELGADVGAQTHHGTRPLHVAAREGQLEALGVLIALGTHATERFPGGGVSSVFRLLASAGGSM
jgi:hypothetical protein